jgi:predicted nucleic acid-binding protein
MAKADQFVLDGSVALAWYFADEADAYADSIVARFPNAEAFVPTIWSLEIANALLIGERRKRSTVAQATAWVGFLSSLPITVDHETSTRAWTDIINVARVQSLTAYDAAYLELALRRQIPLATLDDRLKAAAKAAGLARYAP